MAVVVVALGAIASLLAGDLGATGQHPSYRTPRELARLLDSGPTTAVVVDAQGKPLRGRDGKPLRVTRHGRIVDSKGRTVRHADGTPLRISSRTLGKGRRLGRQRAAHPAPPATPKHRHAKAPGNSATSAPIVIGVAYNDAERLNEIYARYGGHARASDGGVVARAVADYINATGGIGGRKLQLRLRQFDTTDGRPYDVTFAEVCNFFAEGTRPLAVIAVGQDDELAPCLASKNIALISDFPKAGSTAIQAQFPFFQPGSLALDRFAAPYIQLLASQGFFKGGRVGLLRYSDPQTDAVVDGFLRPALKAAGVKLTAEQAVPVTQNVNDISGLLTRIGSAIVRFRAAGVNRVISVDDRGDLIGLFMQAAGPAGYRPRYGLSSLNSPLFLRASLPPDELHGSIGMGWSPITDVAAAQEGPINATRALCDQIFQRAGVQDLGDRTAFGEYAAYSRCSNLLMLQKALAHSDATDPAQLRAAIEALGSRFQSAVAMSTDVGRGRDDGAASYRLLRFDDGCGCFRYDGAPRSL